jgi:hypothetical protein
MKRERERAGIGKAERWVCWCCRGGARSKTESLTFLACCLSRSVQDKTRTVLTMDDLSASLSERGIQYVPLLPLDLNFPQIYFRSLQSLACLPSLKKRLKKPEYYQ